MSYPPVEKAEFLNVAPVFLMVLWIGHALLHPSPYSLWASVSQKWMAGAFLGASGLENDAKKKIETVFNLQVCSTFCL